MPTKKDVNITRLALAADVSRRQVRRDLEAGAPTSAKEYLAWRRARHSDRGSLEHAIARGVFTWRAFDHERRRYVERTGLEWLCVEILSRVRAAVAELDYWPDVVARGERTHVIHELREDFTRTLYSVGQMVFFDLVAREPDEPEKLRRPSQPGLAGCGNGFVRAKQPASNYGPTFATEG
jgi:hypothetical protein